MTKRWKRLAIALAITGVSIAAIVAAARVFVPPWLGRTIERVASEATGRDLTIAGPFELSWSLSPTLTASDITLANASWGSEASMLRVGRARLSLELASLWSGPVRVRMLEIERVRLLIEADGEGRGNWMFDVEPQPARPPRRLERSPVVFDDVAVRAFELDYRRRPGARPVRFGVAELTARRGHADGMIDFASAGSFNDAPWELSGRLGTLDRLYEGRDVDQILTGRIGRTRVALSGRIRDPLHLRDPDIEFGLDGPDIEAALATFGLRSPLAGPFQLKGRLIPVEHGVGFELNAALADVTATARGSAGALLAPGAIDAAVEATGPDASLVGSWTNVKGLPARPFVVAGRVRFDKKKFSLDGVKLRVGPTSVGVDGVIGEPPRCVGTKLDVTGSGRDLSELSALTRLRLPSRPFKIRGRFLRRADGLAIEGVDLRIAEASILAGGTIGEPPHLQNFDLTLEASGPDLSWFSSVATVGLPEEPFVLRGRVERNGPGLDLHGITGRLGDAGVNADGRVVPVKRLEGSELQVHVAGPDLAKLASHANLRGVPSLPFDVQGRVRVVAGGYELDSVSARAGRLRVTGAGHLGVPPALDGTSLTLAAEGDALSDLEAWGLPEKLPADPFRVSGTVRVNDDAYVLNRVVADLGGDRLRVDGTLGTRSDLSRMDVSVNASGSSFRDLGRFFAAFGAKRPMRLPSEPYEASGRVRRVPTGFEVHEARAKVGGLELLLDGSVESGEGLRGTDLRFDVRGPDTSILENFAGRALPDGPFEAHGRLARVDAGLLFNGVTIAVGGSDASISGTLGPLPKLPGTDLDVSVSGPDLAALLGPVIDFPSLPSDAFEVSAHLSGSVERFVSKSFVARLGDSDLRGSASIRLDGRPFVEADLSSKRLDVSALLRGLDEVRETVPPKMESAKPEPREGERIISGEPLPFDGLRTIDATLRLTAAEVNLPGVPLRDVVVEGELRDGRFRADRIEGNGIYGGRASFDLTMEPRGEGYGFRTEGRLDGARLVLSTSDTKPEDAPSLDVEFEVKGEGRSLHDFAASSSGSLLVIAGPGRVSNALTDRIESGVLGSLLDALNPYRKSSPYTKFECGIASAAIAEGKAVVEPIATRTDKLTAIGHGKVDFGTEKVELVWTLKPRRGIGLSAASIANPYIKLSGTLAAPRLDVKPLEAAASTGAAVATAGLTIFLRGLYDRITAEKNVCVKALAKARRQIEPRKGDAVKAE